ncbi:unnamed protein product, partial [Durusdinium trenchii]
MKTAKTHQSPGEEDVSQYDGGQQQLWIGAAKDGSGLVPLNDTFNGEVEVQHAK